MLEQAAKVHGSDDRPLIPLSADISTKEGCLALAEDFSSTSRSSISSSRTQASSDRSTRGPTPPTLLARTTRSIANSVSRSKNSPRSPSRRNSPDDWDSLFRINVYATYFLSLAFLPLLSKGTEASKAGRPPSSPPEASRASSSNPNSHLVQLLQSCCTPRYQDARFRGGLGYHGQGAHQCDRPGNVMLRR